MPPSHVAVDCQGFVWAAWAHQRRDSSASTPAPAPLTPSPARRAKARARASSRCPGGCAIGDAMIFAATPRLPAACGSSTAAPSPCAQFGRHQPGQSPIPGHRARWPSMAARCSSPIPPTAPSTASRPGAVGWFPQWPRRGECDRDRLPAAAVRGAPAAAKGRRAHPIGRRGRDCRRDPTRRRSSPRPSRATREGRDRPFGNCPAPREGFPRRRPAAAAAAARTPSTPQAAGTALLRASTAASRSACGMLSAPTPRLRGARRSAWPPILPQLRCPTPIPLLPASAWTDAPAAAPGEDAPTPSPAGR